MSQEEMDECWKRLAEKMEKEVLHKCNVEDSRSGAYRGRGSSLEWRRVARSFVQRIQLAASAKHA